MKKLFIILFCLVTFSVHAQTKYYVATDGDDSNAGTIGSPWKTWGKAFNASEVDPGDTVFFRGGIYYKLSTESVSASNSGTSDNHIVFINYPGEEPILDCGTYRPTTEYNYGIKVFEKQYIDLIGLTIRNVLQPGGDNGIGIIGIYFYSGNEVRAIECKSYNISGIGFQSAIGGNEVRNHYFINCDTWNIIDTLSAPGYVAGRGTGFRAVDVPSGLTKGRANFIGCRAWNCSDQGFSTGLEMVSVIKNCWSFGNGGYYGSGDSGEGIGFKLGWADFKSDEVRRYVSNCIAAYNDFYGFGTNDYNTEVAAMEIYNNIAYKNGYNYIGGSGYGFWVTNTKDVQAKEEQRIFRNNIAYANKLYEMNVQSGAYYTHSNNSWDSEITLTNADFKALPLLDSEGIALLSSPRKPDGSLPDIGDYFQLKEGSDAIDAGIDVGLPYYGSAPDLGAFEYIIDEPQINTREPVILRSREVVAGGSIIYDGGGMISAKGICISQETDPDINDTLIVAGTGTADFTVRVPNLTKSTTYHVRAYATNETGTAYGADVEFTTPASSPVKTGGKLLKHGNYYIKIE